MTCLQENHAVIHLKNSDLWLSNKWKYILNTVFVQLSDKDHGNENTEREKRKKVLKFSHVIKRKQTYNARVLLEVSNKIF